MHSYFSYVKYVDLCAALNPSTIEDLEDQKPFLIFVQSYSQSYQRILQEESHTIDLLTIYLNR